MKVTLFITLSFLSLIFIGAPTQGEARPAPDMGYLLTFGEEGCSQKTSDVLTVEIWAQSYADHGVACAFVDFTTNMTVTDITFGSDYTVFNSGEIDNFGVADLGGCSLVASGVGQDPDWSLVATLDLEISSNVRRFWAFVDDPSHPALGTSIFGEGSANNIDYGKTLRCRQYPQNSRTEK